MELKINFEELRMQLDEIIKDEKMTDEQLMTMQDFFMEHRFVVDNEIKKRFWKKYKIEQEIKQ